MKNSGKTDICSDSSPTDDPSSEGMFNNDIPRDNECQKCSKNEKMLQYLKFKLDKHEKKDKQDNSNKIYSNKINFVSMRDGKKIILKKPMLDVGGIHMNLITYHFSCQNYIT
nr:A1l transcription factor [Mimivirus sp.]